MNNLLLFIDDNSLIILTITAVLIILLFFVNVSFFTLFWGVKNRLKFLFQGSKAQDLEEVIAQQIKRQLKSEEKIKELVKSSRELRKMAVKSIQQVGVVRFNPFKDTGGDQSFAIALLDSNDNGLVVSNLFSREGSRVYAKPIDKGKSKYPLSQEEEEAIKRAKGRK